MRMRAGFTLTEVLVAMSLLAIASGVAVPYFISSLPGYRSSGATRQLLADLRLARTLAIEQGVDVLVVFHSPGTNEYQIALDTHPPAPGNDHRLTADDRLVKTVKLRDSYAGIGFSSSDADAPADGVSFTDNLAVFAPDGRSSSGSVYLQPLTDLGVRRDRDRRVTVVGATGRARAYRWRGGGWE